MYTLMKTIKIPSLVKQKLKRVRRVFTEVLAELVLGLG